MKTDIENNEWKAEAPYVAGLPLENPFRVPEQYFEGLSQKIANSVYLSELKQQTGEAGYTVPDQYFATLKEQILAETSNPISTRFPAAHGFSTPDGYFEKLQSRITAETVDKRPSSKIVRLWHSGLLKYASAACFVLLSTFGIYLNQHNFSKTSTTVDLANEQMLYDISEQDVIDHIEGSSPDVQKTSIPDTDMENYILNNYSQNDLSSAL